MLLFPVVGCLRNYCLWDRYCQFSQLKRNKFGIFLSKCLGLLLLPSAPDVRQNRSSRRGFNTISYAYPFKNSWIRIVIPPKHFMKIHLELFWVIQQTDRQTDKQTNKRIYLETLPHSSCVCMNGTVHWRRVLSGCTDVWATRRLGDRRLGNKFFRWCLSPKRLVVQTSVDLTSVAYVMWWFVWNISSAFEITDFLCHIYARL